MNTTYQYPFTPFPYYNGYPLMPFYSPQWDNLKIQQNAQNNENQLFQMNACFPNESEKKNDESSENCKVGQRREKKIIKEKFLGD